MSYFAVVGIGVTASLFNPFGHTGCHQSKKLSQKEPFNNHAINPIVSFSFISVAMVSLDYLEPYSKYRLKKIPL